MIHESCGYFVLIEVIVSSYGNWTNNGWSLRIHGNVYKIPNVSQSKIDDLANVFLIGTSVKDLNATEQAQARNVTKSIFVVQQGNRKVTMNLKNNVAVQSNATGGAVNAVRRSLTSSKPGKSANMIMMCRKAVRRRFTCLIIRLLKETLTRS